MLYYIVVIFINIMNSLKDTLTKQQLYDDYKVVDDFPSTAEKKALAAKYGCAPKNKDIQHAILVELQKIRAKQTTFNDQDITDFQRLIDWKERYNIFGEALKNESIEFVKYFMEVQLQYIKTKKLECYMYGGGSASQNRQITIYKNLLRFLNEQSDDYKTQQLSIESIYNIIKPQMDEFKKIFLEKVKISSEELYNKIPENVNNIYDKIRQFTNKLKNNEISYKEYNDSIKPLENNWFYKYGRSIVHRFKTVKEYISYRLDEAEKEFDESLMGIANRVSKKEFDINNIKISEVKNDPKFFEMVITDGKKTLHARSIIAASYSSYMKEHLRFILT